MYLLARRLLLMYFSRSLPPACLLAGGLRFHNSGVRVRKDPWLLARRHTPPGAHQLSLSLSLALSPSPSLPTHTHTRRHSMQAARLPVFKPYLDLKVLQSPERPKLLPQKRLTKKSKDIVSFRHPSSKPHPNTRYPDSLAASPALHPETYLEP